jgi:hypothetical protein
MPECQSDRMSAPVRRRVKLVRCFRLRQSRKRLVEHGATLTRIKDARLGGAARSYSCHPTTEHVFVDSDPDLENLCPYVGLGKVEAVSVERGCLLDCFSGDHKADKRCDNARICR